METDLCSSLRAGRRTLSPDSLSGTFLFDGLMNETGSVISNSEMGALHLETRAALLRAHHVESEKYKLRHHLESLHCRQQEFLSGKNLSGQQSTTPNESGPDNVDYQNALSLCTSELKSMKEAFIRHTQQSQKDSLAMWTEITSLREELKTLQKVQKDQRETTAEEEEKLFQSNSQVVDVKDEQQQEEEEEEEPLQSTTQLVERDADIKVEDVICDDFLKTEPPDDRIEDKLDIVADDSRISEPPKDCSHETLLDVESPITYWEEVTTHGGGMFYYQRETKTKRWKLPLGGQVVTRDENKPENWTKYENDSGVPYFVNKKTRSKQWSVPPCLSSSTQQTPVSVQTCAEKKRSQKRQVFEGSDWVEYEYEGRIFYLNSKTKTKVWDMPSELIIKNQSKQTT